VVTSIFVGGGTPSLVEASALVGVLDTIRGAWPVAEDCEITVECNPESMDPSKLEAYLAGGVNRLSFGVQSLDDELLRWLGRLHDAPTAVRAVRAARRAGFESVNGDLIFGVPGETDEAWRASVEGLLAGGVTHMSCYGLTYEEGTPLHEWRKLGRITPVPDDDVARRWEITDELLGGAGFARYEISNWAPPGQACRHNQLYWACGEYLGIGAGAHSHLAGPRGATRSWALRSPQRWTERVVAHEPVSAGSEEVGAAGRAAEVMFLGLRRTAGVAAADFEALTTRTMQDAFGGELARLANDGLLTWDGATARLTPRGTLLANEAVCAFLDT
jgi:oxygen-independent coproporphyrinogen-3 oxidase